MRGDPCGPCCKGAFGICRTQRTCWHHIEARIEEEKPGRSPVRDPTGNAAVNNIMRERKRKQRRKE